MKIKKIVTSKENIKYLVVIKTKAEYVTVSIYNNGKIFKKALYHEVFYMKFLKFTEVVEIAINKYEKLVKVSELELYNNWNGDLNETKNSK